MWSRFGLLEDGIRANIQFAQSTHGLNQHKCQCFCLLTPWYSFKSGHGMGEASAHCGTWSLLRNFENSTRGHTKDLDNVVAFW